MQGQKAITIKLILTRSCLWVTVLLPAWSVSAMFTCQPIIFALITGILSTAALLKLCHNKTVFIQEYTHTTETGCLFNLEDKNMIYWSLTSAVLQQIFCLRNLQSRACTMPLCFNNDRKSSICWFWVNPSLLLNNLSCRWRGYFLIITQHEG